MNKILCVFIIILAPQIWANTLVLQSYNPTTKKYEKVEVREYNGLRLTQDCFKDKTPKCEAWSIAQKNKVAGIENSELTGHPAAKYCAAVGAMGRIFKDKDGDVDYCVFKDKSGIDAWDLYYKHHGK